VNAGFGPSYYSNRGSPIPERTPTLLPDLKVLAANGPFRNGLVFHNQDSMGNEWMMKYTSGLPARGTAYSLTLRARLRQTNAPLNKPTHAGHRLLR